MEYFEGVMFEEVSLKRRGVEIVVNDVEFVVGVGV